MNKNILTIVGNLDNQFESDSPLQVFAYLTAVKHYGFESGEAQEIAKLCFELYIDINFDINAVALIDFVCEQYDDLPNDFNEIKDLVISYVDRIDR